MFIIVVKEGKMVVAMDDLDYVIQDVAFKAKVFNWNDTFNHIANKSLMYINVY
jgi:hypothetical protein